MITGELIQLMENYQEGDLASLSEILGGLGELETLFGPAGSSGKEFVSLLTGSLERIRDLPDVASFLAWLASVGKATVKGVTPGFMEKSRKELLLWFEGGSGKEKKNPKKANTDKEEEKADTQNRPEMLIVKSSKAVAAFGSPVSAAELDYSAFVIDRTILETFLQESDEFLNNAQLSLLDLEHDSGNKEAVNVVFRCFHTLKSSAAFLGIKNVELIAHNMESMLQKVRDGSLKINGDLTDVMFFGMSFIRDLVAVIPGNQFQKDKIIETWRSVEIRGFIEVINRIIQLHSFKKIGEILEEMGKIDRELVDRILKCQNKENKKFGEIAVAQKIITREDLDTAVKRQEFSRVGQSFVKVSVDRLNTLVDMVGELVVNQSMFRSELHKYEGILPERDVIQLESITTTIKNIVLSMGMVPVGEVFQKLRIVIRNTGRELGKLVNLEIEGEDTELDRNLVEGIYDPLVHIVRNAVSHGIESPEEREKAGKKPVGNLKITARYKGNGIEISIIDDGRGIDPERVIDKAIQSGIIKEEERQSYRDDWKRTCEILFMPGFSTKDQADTVSGRGVGLDVVMQNISRINGRVDIQSEKGQSVAFTIKLPLTLAIIDGFVIETEGQKFVLPFNLVEEIMVPSEVTVSRLENGMEMLRSRDRYVPVIDLKRLLGVKTEMEYIGRYVYILVSFDEHFYAIPVDRVIGKQEIVIKNLSEVLRRQRLFSSGTIFGDGTIGFILDLDEIKGRMDRLYG